MDKQKEQYYLPSFQLDAYLDRCLGVLQKYGFTPDPYRASREALEDYIHKYYPPNEQDSKTIGVPWYRMNYSDQFIGHIEGALCEVGSSLRKLPDRLILGSPSLDEMRKMTWECAMILFSFDGRVYCSYTALNALCIALGSLLIGMGYSIHDPEFYNQNWATHPEWVDFEEACKKKEKEITRS